MAYTIPGQMIPLDSGSTAVVQFAAVSVDATGVILPGSTADPNVIGEGTAAVESTVPFPSVSQP